MNWKPKQRTDGRDEFMVQRAVQEVMKEDEEVNYSERLRILDEEIDESIGKTQNAKTGEEVKVSIIEFERLMLTREKIFTEYVMSQRESKKKEGNAAGWQLLCIQGIAIIALAVAVILLKQ